ncbi:ParB/RepB/Spo0J family partition protein [Candidatus Poribacteria bacterium]|nr:ParB/RepB/Spo0J family partition protein [Candidatus Poribacteria bacterium]
MNKDPLGRGLSALIPDAVKKQTTDRVISISVDIISPNPYQPRLQMNSEALEELAASIKEKGVVQPIIVRSTEDGKYEIIAGERRLRASKMAGLSEVPVIIREADDAEAMALAVTENIQREDLNAIELARAYSVLMNHFNLTQEQLAQAVGKSRPAVANIMRLLQLPQEIQDAVLDGKISMGHARALLALESEKQQQSVCQKIIESDLSVRQTEKLVQKIIKQSEPKKQDDEIQPEIEALENRLKTMLATQVKIKQGRKKGSIEIEYYSEDDLDRITSILEAGLASTLK